MNINLTTFLNSLFNLNKAIMRIKMFDTTVFFLIINHINKITKLSYAKNHKLNLSNIGKKYTSFNKKKFRYTFKLICSNCNSKFAFILNTEYPNGYSGDLFFKESFIEREYWVTCNEMIIRDIIK